MLAQWAAIFVLFGWTIFQQSELSIVHRFEAGVERVEAAADRLESMHQQATTVSGDVNVRVVPDSVARMRNENIRDVLRADGHIE